jgi:hypothetical protein
MSQYAEQSGFGAGVLIATRNDIVGSSARKFGILQDVAVDFSADLKELYGSKRYPIALAPGKTKIEIKAKFAGIRGAIYNDLYFGATTAATQTLFMDSEAASVPTVSTYIVTVANSAKFLTDQGVFYVAGTVPFTRVATAPTIGQYSVVVATGVYTFAAADASAAVLISYTYSSTTGLQIPIVNTPLGLGPIFSVVLSDPYDQRQLTYTFNACQASKLSLPTKQDDFMISEMDFMAAQDVNGNIGMINVNL